MSTNITKKSLNQILEAREERAALRREFCINENFSISLNLNIPGIPKNNIILAAFFDAIVDDLNIYFTAHRLKVLQQKKLNNNAGDFIIFEIQDNNHSNEFLKNLTENFEQNHPCGRFIDLDLCDTSGKLVSSGKQKVCFYCNQQAAIICMLSKNHSFTELRNFQHKKIVDYLNQSKIKNIARKISSMAIRSLLYEISLTPKPGLIDFESNGVHKDMNFRTFIDSTSVLSVYFDELFLSGFLFKNENYSEALPEIRILGLQMEKDMFEATHGVNTQKGIIFLMGITLFSLGILYQKNKTYSSEQHQLLIQKICSNLVINEFQINVNGFETHGEKCFEKYRIGGVRQEVQDGLPTVFNKALPLLFRHKNLDNNTLYKVLVQIMSKLDDTNILHRSNMQTLLDFQKLCKRTLHNFSFSAYNRIIDFCNQKNISPGGAADLLSISIFLYMIKKSEIHLKLHK